ncbi:MAG TPA: glycerol-3-phosphate dehydrogenase [Eubacteriaceae bacterium]|jgi:glycerol-3-phosphate dehydrogenase (NAD(P)+)|nr:glycerol-3-phosphate dehydrogenase [Eubacteriaceae bacterium]
MEKITIIGAGAMGSALTTPLIENGHEVRLWGTELDGHIIDELRKGNDHPKHKYPLLKEAKLFKVDELEQAMEESKYVIMAITSDALGKIFERVVSYLTKDSVVATVSKGFDFDKEGNIVILPEILKEKLPKDLKSIPIVAVGGPCKANEVLYRSPTCVVYASEDATAADKFKELIATDVYNVKTDSDIIGTEICAAMKNAYAVSLGMAEGYKGIKGLTHNNTKSALFTIATEEMDLFVTAMGGSPRSVYGLPGSGDLEVTGEAGRNRILGEVVGEGTKASAAIQRMQDEDITVEGYPAIKFGYNLVKKLDEQGKIDAGKLPLLTALYEILYQDAHCYEKIQKVLNDYCNS